MGSFHLTKTSTPPAAACEGLGECKAHCTEHKTSSHPSGKAQGGVSNPGDLQHFRKRVIKQCGSIKEADLRGEQCYSLQREGAFLQINLLPAALMMF